MRWEKRITGLGTKLIEEAHVNADTLDSAAAASGWWQDVGREEASVAQRRSDGEPLEEFD